MIGGRKIYTVYRATSRIDGSMYIGMTRRPVSNVVSGKERSVKGWRVMREGNGRGGLNGSI